jgi:hypothetical protein
MIVRTPIASQETLESDPSARAAPDSRFVRQRANLSRAGMNSHDLPGIGRISAEAF